MIGLCQSIADSVDFPPLISVEQLGVTIFNFCCEISLLFFQNLMFLFVSILKKTPNFLIRLIQLCLNYSLLGASISEEQPEWSIFICYCEIMWQVFKKLEVVLLLLFVEIVYLENF